jgi:hypothetical protein
VRLGAFALVARRPGEAHRSAQLPKHGALLLRNRDRLAVAGLGRRRIACRQQHVPLQPNPLGVNGACLCRFCQTLRPEEVLERGLQQPGHAAGVGKKGERQGHGVDKATVAEARQTAAKERNPVDRKPQGSEATAALDQGECPVMAEPMLGRQCHELVDVSQQRARFQAEAPAFTARRSSGSSRADSAVEPTRSQNITVSCRRSAPSTRGAGDDVTGAGAPAASIGLPQPPQNAAEALFSNPQCAHGIGRPAPQRAQKRLVAA